MGVLKVGTRVVLMKTLCGKKMGIKILRPIWLRLYVMYVPTQNNFFVTYIYLVIIVTLINNVI
jgi:hypothetical protein